MNLVKQREFGECGIACLAMVTGLDYDTVKEIIDDPAVATYGIRTEQMLVALHQAGFTNPHEIFGVPADEARAAILTVPSLNHPGMLHFIVWDGSNYFDPSAGAKEYPQDAYLVDGHPQVMAACSIAWTDEPLTPGAERQTPGG